MFLGVPDLFDMRRLLLLQLEHPGTSGLEFLMSNAFTASVRENPGRQFLVVEFRHPLKNDSSNRRGKKIRKGLGTADRDEAEMLVGQLNEILRDESLWSVGARPEAARRGFEPRVLEIFYAELEPSSRSAKGAPGTGAPVT